MLSTIVGLHDGADEQNKWVRVVRDLEELRERPLGARRSHVEELVRNCSNNDMDGQVPDGDRQLLGREGVHEAAHDQPDPPRAEPGARHCRERAQGGGQHVSCEAVQARRAIWSGAGEHV